MGQVIVMLTTCLYLACFFLLYKRVCVCVCISMSTNGDMAFSSSCRDSGGQQSCGFKTSIARPALFIDTQDDIVD
ncbi:uncharacterized protein EV154DRAFT_489693 [Mucor mucedo]|uniref:uncharacterized protein n=1 Tax=Mucor mucedo TaxID=29922 RepID=UPI00221F7F87|nr:uncharacterized protein EV154DRAFT_489693 [Mucor mucedo]KAI7897323.1 hypothetical protein EV154DRAFT_489693 [Mucor mucedo]